MYTLRKVICDGVHHQKVFLDYSKIHPGEFLFSVSTDSETAARLLASFGGDIVPKTNSLKGVEWRLEGPSALAFAESVYTCLDQPKRNIVASWQDGPHN